MKKDVVFEITGVTWLMFNNPLSMMAAQTPSGKKGKVGPKKIPTPQEEIDKKFYEIDGQLYFPSIGFRAALIEACKFMKIGKLAAPRVMKGAVFCVEEESRLFNPKTQKPFTRKNAEIDIRRVVIQRSAIMRARPKVEKWGCKFVLSIDDDFLTKEQVLDRLQAAGIYPGIGEWRPEKGGSYGRFIAELG